MTESYRITPMGIAYLHWSDGADEATRRDASSAFSAGWRARSDAVHVLADALQHIADNNPTALWSQIAKRALVEAAACTGGWDPE